MNDGEKTVADIVVASRETHEHRRRCQRRENNFRAVTDFDELHHGAVVGQIPFRNIDPALLSLRNDHLVLCIVSQPYLSIQQVLEFDRGTGVTWQWLKDLDTLLKPIEQLTNRLSTLLLHHRTCSSGGNAQSTTPTHELSQNPPQNHTKHREQRDRDQGLDNSEAGDRAMTSAFATRRRDGPRTRSGWSGKSLRCA